MAARRRGYTAPRASLGDGGKVASTTTLTPKQVESYVMRTTGPQQFFTQNFATLGNFNIPKPIPLQQPLAFIEIRWKGRIVIAGANYTSTAPEALQNILQQVRLVGTHNVLGQLTPIQMSGATLFAMNRLFNPQGNLVIINGVAQPSLTKPMGYAAATFGNTGTYDVQIFWTVPVFPYGVPDRQAIQYLYNAAAWGQTLQLQITTGDLTSFGTPAGMTTVAFSAFGTGGGSPAIDINLTYASLGPLANSINQAVVVRNVTTINSQLQSNANQVRLALLQNQRTMNVIQKTGTLLAGTSAGVSVFGTLSDAITEQTILRVNNNPIRNLQYNDVTAAFYGYRFQTVMPTGYLPISFVDSDPAANSFAAFKGDQLTGSAQFDIAANVVGAAGSNQGEIIQDMIYGEPQVAGQS
jgi:hypothetical protein